MILFIFEGGKYEPKLYDHVKSIFFPKREDQVLCSFCSSIYTFYKHIKNEYGGFAEVVDVLKNELKKNNPKSELFNYKSSDFESVYLFFDYDFHNGDLSKKNEQIKELLAFFNEETVNGKLFLSYPMIESIQYIKKLPDNNFFDYKVTRENCKNDNFKKAAKKFCHYQGYDYLNDISNWMHIICHNVQKANYLINDKLDWPNEKDDVEQSSLFKAQLEKHVESKEEVAILNAFPMFLFYYFPKDHFENNKTAQNNPNDSNA